MAWYSDVLDFVSGDSVRGAVDLASGAFDLYSGVSGVMQQQKYADQASKLAELGISLSKEQQDRLRKLYYPMEEKQAKEAQAAFDQLAPVRAAQRQYAVGRGLQDVKQAGAIDKILDPVELDVINRLSESEPELAERYIGQAVADVQSGFGRAAQQQARGLAAYGVSPTSGAFQEQQRKTSQAQALAEATGRTQAAQRAEDVSLGRQAQALGYRKGIALPQMQTTPQVNPAAVSQGIMQGAGTFSGLAGQAGRQASRSLAGAQYSFSDLFRK